MSAFLPDRMTVLFPSTENGYLARPRNGQKPQMKPPPLERFTKSGNHFSDKKRDKTKS
jgi:hypothetical protein